MQLRVRLDVDLDLSFQDENCLVADEYIRSVRRRSNIFLIDTPDSYLQVRLITNPKDAAKHLASANIEGLGGCFGRIPMPSILFAHANLPYWVPFIKDLGLSSFNRPAVSGSSGNATGRGRRERPVGHWSLVCARSNVPYIVALGRLERCTKDPRFPVGPPRPPFRLAVPRLDSTETH